MEHYGAASIAESHFHRAVFRIFLSTEHWQWADERDCYDECL